MNTKYFKILIATFCVCSFSNSAISQLYLKLGLNQFNAAQASSDYNSTQNGSSYTYKLSKMGLGAGTGLSAGLGFMLSEHLGVELNGIYQMGKKNTTTNKYTNNSNETSVHSNGLIINPSLVVRTGEGKINMYLRTGLLYGLNRKVIVETNDESVFLGTTTKTNEINEITMNSGLGFNAATGINLGLSDNLTIFGEVVFNGLNLWTKSAKLTKSTKNGADQLPSMSVRDKETEYVTEYTTSTPDPNKPSTDLTNSMNLSNWGFQIGIKLNLGNSK